MRAQSTPLHLLSKLQISMVPEISSITEGILESEEQTLVVLSPLNRRPFRRVLFVNSYGGKDLWRKIKKGLLPPHHLWGCLELVRAGYEVALAEPVHDFNVYRPLPHDLKLLKVVRSWLRKDDIIYCGHNVLHWIPLLKALGLLRPRVVSLLYAREPLHFSRLHAGIIALNPAAAEHARKLAPKVKVATLRWGVDLNFVPRIHKYSPEWLLSCGITFRDHQTLSIAASTSGRPLRVICPERPAGIKWPPNVEITESGRGWNTQEKSVSYNQLLNDYYGGAAASLIITGRDDEQHGACGFTNLIEALAVGRPVILTRTGALVSEIDVEREGCGLHVPPGDPAALAQAMDVVCNDPVRAEAMGRAGRALCETRYDISQYGRGLHEFFQSL